jgi:hypothetical protein
MDDMDGVGMGMEMDYGRLGMGAEEAEMMRRTGPGRGFI